MALFESGFVKRAALDAGFDICGLARTHRLDAEHGFLEQWLSNGLDGGLAYMHRNLDKRLSPELLVEGAKTVIVCGVSYLNDTSLGYVAGSDISRFAPAVSSHCSAVSGSTSYAPAAAFGTPRVASYARAADYHDTIRGMLHNLAKALEREYGSFSWRAFCDSAPVLEKRWAVEAGLGWQGRNSLIINSEIGSCFLLGELLVGVEADIYDVPYSGVGCGECRRCEESCPNRAIVSDVFREPAVSDIPSRGVVPDGVGGPAISHCIDARRCIARATIERPDIRQPDIVRPDIEVGIGPEKVPLAGWIFGCDECQSVCPYNIKARLYRNPAFIPLFDPRQLDREFWLTLSECEFREKFGRTPLCRAGLEMIKLNLGNNNIPL